MEERSLERLLGFGDADLAANRGGRLSPGQILRLAWSGILRLVLGPLILIASLVIGYAVSGDAWFATIILLVVAVFALYITWHGFAFLVDAADRSVAFVTAPLQTRMVTGKSTSYFASIGPVTKTISARTYESLPQGISCHLYYAPGSRSLLSIEPANTDEPKPAHPFGPDSAHVWDRLRWSWVMIAIGALGVVIGAHAISLAHPAHPVSVSGTVYNYYEHTGKSGTTRNLYLTGDATPYTPQSEDAYTPPLQSYYSFVGKQVVLYIDRGTRNVIGVADEREQLHAADWYLHPEDETGYEIETGASIVAASLLGIGIGVAIIVAGRRRAAAAPAPDPTVDPAVAPAFLYAPPSVRPVQANWSPATIVILVGLVLFFGIALASHR